MTCSYSGPLASYSGWLVMPVPPSFVKDAAAQCANDIVRYTAAYVPVLTGSELAKAGGISRFADVNATIFTGSQLSDDHSISVSVISPDLEDIRRKLGLSPQLCGASFQLPLGLIKQESHKEAKEHFVIPEDSPMPPTDAFSPSLDLMPIHALVYAVTKAAFFQNEAILPAPPRNVDPSASNTIPGALLVNGEMAYSTMPQRPVSHVLPANNPYNAQQPSLPSPQPAITPTPPAVQQASNNGLQSINPAQAATQPRPEPALPAVTSGRAAPSESKGDPTSPIGKSKSDYRFSGSNSVDGNKEGHAKEHYPERLEQALAEFDHKSPTPAQLEAGNFRKHHIHLHGFDISIEYPAGATRYFYSHLEDGDTSAPKVSGKRNMLINYGYLRRVGVGADGDPVDVYVGEHPESEIVFVVDQVKKDGTFDEHKVMLGFRFLEEAKDMYLKHYPKNWTGLGAITPMTMVDFKKWLDGDLTKPVGLKKTAALEDLLLHFENFKTPAAQYPDIVEPAKPTAELVELRAGMTKIQEKLAEMASRSNQVVQMVMPRTRKILRRNDQGLITAIEEVAVEE